MSRCMPTTRSRVSPTRTVAATAPRGSSVGRWSAWLSSTTTPLAHEQRIAVPTDRIGAAVQQVDGNIVAMIFEHVRRDRTRARAEAAVGLLQGDDVGIEFAKNRQHSPRIAAAVEADAPCAYCSWRP